PVWPRSNEPPSGTTCLRSSNAPVDSGRSGGVAGRFAPPIPTLEPYGREMPENGSARNVGKVIEIKGVVVDAVFGERLPETYTALRIDTPKREGDEARVLVAEVQQPLGDDRVRAVAMDSTDGLARGVDVIDTGEPISVPVGNETLGRVWNVLG